MVRKSTPPRGRDAGYNWPQFAVHRGEFHMLLYRTLLERAGAGVVRLGSRLTGYRKEAGGTVTALISHADDTTSEATGTLLIGADGIHSAIRAQMHPDQPPIHWGGAVMWHGTALAKPIRAGSSFIGLGSHRHRMVIYPISDPEPETVLALKQLDHGVTPAALSAHDAQLCGPVSELILRNRGSGPFGLLNMVNDRCSGDFDNIDDVIAPEERAGFMAGSKKAAGFAIDALNAAAPTISEGARVGSSVAAE